MAILSRVSQRALWLRRISLVMNFQRAMSAHFLFDLQEQNIVEQVSCTETLMHFFLKIRFEMR